MRVGMEIINRVTWEDTLVCLGCKKNSLDQSCTESLAGNVLQQFQIMIIHPTRLVNVKCKYILSIRKAYSSMYHISSHCFIWLLDLIKSNQINHSLSNAIIQTTVLPSTPKESPNLKFIHHHHGTTITSHHQSHHPPGLDSRYRKLFGNFWPIIGPWRQPPSFSSPAFYSWKIDQLARPGPHILYVFL